MLHFTWCWTSAAGAYLSDHRRPQGGEWAFAPLEIEFKNHKFLENLKSAVLFLLIDLILAMTVYLPAMYPYCTRARFTALMSCSDELAVHSCPLLCLRRQVAKRASRLFYCWTLLRNNYMVTNLLVFTWNYGRRRFAACDCSKQTYSVGNAARQWLLSAVSHIFLLYTVWKA